jgi:hypothetical protein
VRGGGDFGGFFPGAMVAPEVVVVERLEVGVDGNDAGSGGVERDGFDGRSVDAGVGDGGAHGGCQRVHVVGVALRGVVGVFFLAQQRILGHARAELAFGAVEQRHADAEGSEIDAGYDAHEKIPFSPQRR